MPQDSGGKPWPPGQAAVSRPAAGARAAGAIPRPACPCSRRLRLSACRRQSRRRSAGDRGSTGSTYSCRRAAAAGWSCGHAEGNRAGRSPRPRRAAAGTGLAGTVCARVRPRRRRWPAGGGRAERSPGSAPAAGRDVLAVLDPRPGTCATPAPGLPVPVICGPAADGPGATPGGPAGHRPPGTRRPVSGARHRCPPGRGGRCSCYCGQPGLTDRGQPRLRGGPSTVRGRRARVGPG